MHFRFTMMIEVTGYHWLKSDCKRWLSFWIALAVPKRPSQEREFRNAEVSFLDEGPNRSFSCYPVQRNVRNFKGCVRRCSVKGLSDWYFESLHNLRVSFLKNFYMLQGNDLELELLHVWTLNMIIIVHLTHADFRNGLQFNYSFERRFVMVNIVYLKQFFN